MDGIKRQGDIMKEQILADNRPWVDVKITVVGDGDMLGKDGGITVPIKYETTNHGGTPALGVWLHTELVLFTPGFDFDTEQSKLCQMGQKDPPVYAFGGHDLFPKRDFKMIVTHVINKSGVEKSLQVYENLTGNPIDIINLFIIGCVTYRYTFDHTIHTTPILGRLRKKNTNISIDDVPTLDFDSRLNLRTKAGPIPLNTIFVTPEITMRGMRAD
ncbi:MAG: hypothetical protein ABIU05_21255 [Nitrospirales bacterium]